MKDKLIIFDTTLRDGEQSPGASMTKDEKIRIAKALERMRVDVIEAGFPVASPGDFEAVQAVAATVKESTVCGLARALERDIDTAAAALKGARSARIHTFIATSPIHMRSKLKMSPEQVIEHAVKAVKRARSHVEDVEFSPEDAGRSDFEFLCRVLEAVIGAGARTVNIPDTVGYSLPVQFGALIKDLIERVPNSDKAVFSVHCHNDLGMAVGNSLSAVLNGARQVECTINGLGERAGNAALEEIVMAVRTRQDQFPCEVGIDTTQILHCSRLVSSITGFPVQPNKAIVGANAFAHESGIHQDGVLKSRETYEIMRAEDVGWHANRMVLGKHSGRNAFRTRLREIGVDFTREEDLNEAFMRFKELADKKHEIFDEDLQALVTETHVASGVEAVKLVSLKVCSETGETPKARITLQWNGNEQQRIAEGSGPVDAAFKAIEGIIESGCNLQLFSVNNITTGSDAQGEVTVRLERAGRIVNGQGADTDIIIASAKAYINALNKVLAAPNGTTRRHRVRCNDALTMLTRARYLEAMGIDVWRRRAAVSEHQTAAPTADAVPAVRRMSWEELRRSVAGCMRCELHRGRTQTVFGVGDPHAEWLIIGEAPGAEEDRQGEPFVGRAGQLLTAMLLAVGLKREQVFIANILKCRPPNNRDPQPEEISCCAPFLERQIALVAPRIILAVGRIAAQNLLNTSTSIGKLRGQAFAYGERRIPLVVTYHPAYLLRSPREKRKVWQDLLFTKRLYGESLREVPA